MSRAGTDQHFGDKGTTLYPNAGDLLAGYKAPYPNTRVLSHSLRNSNLSLFKSTEYFFDKWQKLEELGVLLFTQR
jgi:hypothetical protein